MRGKSPYNKPSIRKTEVYRLLLKLGGEARWKNLKENLSQLGWGPTTLKRVLDEMIREGSVVKEARLGGKGPEVWYKLKIRDENLWETFEKTLDIQQLANTIKTKAQTLKGQEREAFLKDQMLKIVEMVEGTVQVPLYIMVKGALHKSKREDLLAIYDYIFEVFVKEEIKKYAQILMDYPEQALESLLQLFVANKDEMEKVLKAEGLRK